MSKHTLRTSLKWTPVSRIALGLTCVSTTLLLLAAAIGFFPNPAESALRERSQLVETVSLHASVLVSANQQDALLQSLRALIDRNPYLVAVRVTRPHNQELAVFQKSGHTQSSNDTVYEAPVVAGKSMWGTIELRFAPLQHTGFASWLDLPLVRLLVFCAAAGFVVFFLYMRATLQYLDPSKVVPHRVRQALDTLAEGLMILDEQQRIVHMNAAFTKLLGLDQAETIGRKPSAFPWQDAQGNWATELPWEGALAGEEQTAGKTLQLSIEGRGRRTFLVNAAAIGDESGAVRGAIVSLDDVTDLETSRQELQNMFERLKRSRDAIQQQNHELEKLARYDALTSCLNRRSFYAEFEALWAVSKRYGRHLSCVMVDVDHFKSVNDTHGHAAGDHVLQAVSRVLRDTARDADLVCRYGGEEFCLLLPETDLAGADHVAERIRVAISEADCGAVSVTASIGVSSTCLGARDPRELLDQADQALYAAKHGGRNQVIRYDSMPQQPDTEESTQLDRNDGDIEPAATSLIPFPAVSALMAALSFRDADTAAHCRRVADLCSLLARGLMSPSEAYLLEMAALLHDIGKIGIPDRVLFKPSSLTQDEWEVMGRKERIGMAIIEQAFGSPELVRILQLHGAWYGGRPNRPDLPTGLDIPLAARILNIAEAYDAMTSDKPYRPAKTHEEAAEELRRFAGRQFDPELVDRFLEELDARDQTRSAASEQLSRDAVAAIARVTEALAQAVQSEDVQAVELVAQQLQSTAAKYRATELAYAVDELLEAIPVSASSSTEEADLIAIAARVGELLELCSELQRAYLASHVAG